MNLYTGTPIQTCELSVSRSSSTSEKLIFTIPMNRPQVLKTQSKQVTRWLSRCSLSPAPTTNLFGQGIMTTRPCCLFAKWCWLLTPQITCLCSTGLSAICLTGGVSRLPVAYHAWFHFRHSCVHKQQQTGYRHKHAQVHINIYSLHYLHGVSCTRAL